MYEGSSYRYHWPGLMTITKEILEQLYIIEDKSQYEIGLYSLVKKLRTEV